MNVYLQCLVTIPFIAVMFQFYMWIISLKGLERQNHCRVLGIIYTTVGTLCLFFRALPAAVSGLILFMLGMRLLAYSLDRLDKKIFIDRVDDDR